MTPFAAAAWFLTMPLWSVTDPVPWYEQEAEIINEEPGIEDIERDIERRQYRIMEAQPEDIGP